jgi:anti-anti-sigma factor
MEHTGRLEKSRRLVWDEIVKGRRLAMEFAVKEGRETRVTLTGKLDFARVPILMDVRGTLKGRDISKIIFECAGLAYISSSGIRAIIFAKNKIANGMEICMEDVRKGRIDGFMYDLSVLRTVMKAPGNEWGFNSARGGLMV